MKTICTILFCVFAFSSCMQDQMEFSCDPVINEYISNHQEEFVQYTVIDLAASEPLVQQPIFRSFTPEQKRDIWLQKIQFLLDNEPYTDAEYVHVEKLLDHLHENYFSKENLVLEASLRSKFETEWINFAKSNLGWSDKNIAFVVFRVYTNHVQFDAEMNTLITIKQIALADSEMSTCNCNTNMDYCPQGIICKIGDCQMTTGCGWLWSESCDGRCSDR